MPTPTPDLAALRLAADNAAFRLRCAERAFDAAVIRRRLTTSLHAMNYRAGVRAGADVPASLAAVAAEYLDALAADRAANAAAFDAEMSRATVTDAASLTPAAWFVSVMPVYAREVV
jgi:hypothetical protein